VALTERPAEIFPPERFGMSGITFFVVFNNGKDRVQFAMLTKKALSVQVPGVDVPYSHI
jgi:hypothetical protein